LNIELLNLFSVESLRFIRFIIVGVVNTADSYSFYAAYVYMGIPYLIAGTLSFVTSIFFNYFFTRRFVFDKPTHEHTFMYYMVYNGFLYFFSLAILWLFVDICKLTPYMAGFVSLPINAVVSFVILRTIVFRQRRVDLCKVDHKEGV
jgi:putative flippase GtrA